MQSSEVGGECFASDAAVYVGLNLHLGFKGVGELFIHAYGRNCNDNAEFSEICREATYFHVPVQVHWEIGIVEDPGVRTAEENFDQLLDLLDLFQDPSQSLTLILAHCGAGPQDDRLEGSALDDYAHRIRQLLMDYPNVMFDIAGMVGAAADLWRDDQPTHLGRRLLRKMGKHPDRFMIGFDVETRSQEQVAAYVGGISKYSDYLAWGRDNGFLTPAQIGRIKMGNAVNLFGA